MELLINNPFSAMKIIAAEPGTWHFDHQLRSCGEKVWELEITLKSETKSKLPPFQLSMLFPCRDMVCRWHANSFFDKSLLPEWGAGFSGELACGAPVLGYVSQSGNNAMICSVSDALRKTSFKSGIKEFTFELNTEIRFLEVPEPPAEFYRVVLRFDFRSIPFETAMKECASWYAAMESYTPAPVPEGGFDAWYSTWYSYHKDLTAPEVLAECRTAKELGMKGVIVDDGWQCDTSEGIYHYCGDWQPAPSRFPDMKDFVSEVHEMGMKVLLWYSVPFVGFNSSNFSRFEGKYLRLLPIHGAGVLDPRFPEVRAFLTETYVNALKEWNLDGFKLDFIDRFIIPDGEEDPAEKENYRNRDIKLLPAAVDALLTNIMASLREVKKDILVEFRQKYMGPAIRKYGNLLRATDCPGDITANRCRVADLRLTSGETAVHGDMLRWHDSESTESAARQILATLFAVPQISVKLNEIPAEHLEMIRWRLEFYNRFKETLVKCDLQSPHPEQNYPLLRAEGRNEAVSCLYSENLSLELAALAKGKQEIIVNASASENCIVKLPIQAEAEIRSCTGTIQEKFLLLPGIAEIKIPLSGECHLTPRG